MASAASDGVKDTFMTVVTDAVVRPPISVAAAPVMAVSKIVLSVKSCPIFWLNCLAYETKFSRIFALRNRLDCRFHVTMETKLFQLTFSGTPAL